MKNKIEILSLIVGMAILSFPSLSSAATYLCLPVDTNAPMSCFTARDGSTYCHIGVDQNYWVALLPEKPPLEGKWVSKGGSPAGGGSCLYTLDGIAYPEVPFLNGNVTERNCTLLFDGSGFTCAE